MALQYNDGVGIRLIKQMSQIYIRLKKQANNTRKSKLIFMRIL